MIFAAYAQGVATLGESRLFVLHQDDNAFGHAFDYAEALERPESWPIWTKEWVDNGAGLGLSTFTDAWTGCIESELINQYHYDPRIIMAKKIIFRAMATEDYPGSDKYNIVRTQNHEKLRSPQVRAMIASLAASIFLKSDLAKKQELMAKNNRVMEDLYALNGLENHLRIIISKLVEAENSIQAKSKLLAHIYKRCVFPSFQRCGSQAWLEPFAQLVAEIYAEVVSATNPDYAKRFFTALILQVSPPRVEQGLAAV